MRFEEKGVQFLEKSVLSGKFDEGQVTDDLSDEQRNMWEVAKAWDGALGDRNAIRPNSIPGIAKLQNLRILTDLILPRMLRSNYMRRAVPRDVQEKIRAESEIKLLELLDQSGF